MTGCYWEVEDHRTVNAGVRAAVLARYGYTIDVAHTYVALIRVIEASGASTAVVAEFPYSFVLATYTSQPDVLEGLIDTEARNRLVTYKRTRPLSEFANRRHWL